MRRDTGGDDDLLVGGCSWGILAVDLNTGGNEKALYWTCASLLSQLPLSAPLAMEKHLRVEEKAKKASEEKTVVDAATKEATEAALIQHKLLCSLLDYMD